MSATLNEIIRCTEAVAAATLSTATTNRPTGAVLGNPIRKHAEAAVAALWAGVARQAIDKLSCALKDAPTREAKVVTFGIVAAANNCGAGIDLNSDLANAHDALLQALEASNAGEAISRDIAEAIEGTSNV